MSTQIQHAAPADQQTATASDPSQLEKTTIAEMVDSIFPRLDRKGRRGPLNKQEKQWQAARSALAQLLMEFADTQQVLGASQETNLRLRDEMQALIETARAHELRANSLAHDLTKLRAVHTDDRSTMERLALTTTLLIRLTGLEATCFRLEPTKGGNMIELIFMLAGYKATINSYRIIIEGNNRRARRFYLDSDGDIPPNDAMAILTFMGITRDPKDAYSRAVFDKIFETHDATAEQTLTNPSVSECFDGQPASVSFTLYREQYSHKAFG